MTTLVTAPIPASLNTWSSAAAGLAGTIVTPAKLAAMRLGRSVRFRILFIVLPSENIKQLDKVEVTGVRENHIFSIGQQQLSIV
ncbi:MAG: hypothetical protein ICV78_27450 [Tolypothrix sp. Co-bin9]|nr:hypothetical protein [Tolypothrix sp. Co-bin9]